MFEEQGMDSYVHPKSKPYGVSADISICLKMRLILVCKSFTKAFKEVIFGAVTSPVKFPVPSTSSLADGDLLLIPTLPELSRLIPGVLFNDAPGLIP